MRIVEFKAFQDPEGFIGYVKDSLPSLPDDAQGIVRQLLGSGASASVALDALSRAQRYTLFSAVAESTNWAPTCAYGGEDIPWADMPGLENGLCGVCYCTSRG